MSLSVTGLIVVLISVAIASALSLGNNIIHGVIKNIMEPKNGMKKTNKQLNLLIIFIEKVYNIIQLIKMKMNLLLIVLLTTLKNRKINVFYRYEHENKTKSFLVILNQIST